MSDSFEWAILELFGHRQLAGKITEVDRFGVKFCRIDIPSEPPVTQFYGGAAIYGITITTEEIATKVARRTPPMTHALGLPASTTRKETDDDFDPGNVHGDDAHPLHERECEDCGSDIEIEGASHCNSCREANEHDDALVEAVATASALDDPPATTQEEPVPGLTASTEVYVAAAESLRCPHDCTHTLAAGCPHNCSCRNCDIPF